MDKKAFKFSVRDMTPLVLEEESGSSEVTPAGDSDLSIANVTFKWKNVGSSAEGIYMAAPFIGTWIESDAAVNTITLVSAETTVQVILYKGRAGVMFITDGVTIDETETSGGITDIDGREFAITGDAVISLESNGPGPSPYTPE